jgi:hypothetical protein
VRDLRQRKVRRQVGQDELAALSGERTMDASAIREYVAPLKRSLDEENKGQVWRW